jgi:hypothetical protein
VRWPGKSSGAIAFALTFLVLFLSGKKEQQSATTRKKDPIMNHSGNHNTKSLKNVNKNKVSCISHLHHQS